MGDEFTGWPLIRFETESRLCIAALCLTAIALQLPFVEFPRPPSPTTARSGPHPHVDRLRGTPQEHARTRTHASTQSQAPLHSHAIPTAARLWEALPHTPTTHLGKVPHPDPGRPCRVPSEDPTAPVCVLPHPCRQPQTPRAMRLGTAAAKASMSGEGKDASGSNRAPISTPNTSQPQRHPRQQKQCRKGHPTHPPTRTRAARSARCRQVLP